METPLTYIDTHCHLDYLKDKPLEEIMELSQNEGVTNFVTISVRPDHMETVMELSVKYDNVHCTLGIHPHEAQLYTPEVAEQMQDYLKKYPKICAIGEIGLDFHYSRSPHDVQKKVFEEMLELARQQDLPIVVHTRDADDDTLAILKNMAPHLPRKGVVHSFTSSTALAQFALDAGFSLGFNGIITFKNADHVRSVLSMTPVDRILSETDAPFLAPVPFRGRENNPSYLRHIVEKISEVKGVPMNTLAPQLYENAMKLFSIA